MKGLRKYLTPFAPDQSGAVAMCYALGGMVVIVDAGGCAGNICGFDEPRWQPDYLQTFFREALSPESKEEASSAKDTDGSSDRSSPRVAAVFSAGLRDMDAILGRDDLLIKKLVEASKRIDAKFIALIGTPVPAVIGTDLAADAIMAEKSTHLPCIAVSTDGMHLYDKGIEETLLALLRKFSPGSRDACESTEESFLRMNDRSNRHKCSGKDSQNGSARDSGGAFCGSMQDETGNRKRICGVLGLNPLDLFDPAWTEAVRNSLLMQGYEEVLLYGIDGGLDDLKRSALAERNYVVSPAGIAAANYLKERFKTPYEISFPADPMILLEENPSYEAADYGPDERILVVHQQVLANSIRARLKEAGAKGEIVTASWFDMKPELALDKDVRLREEDDFSDLVRDGKWDLIIADPVLRPMAADYRGRWIDAYHFAVSGQAAIDRSRRAGTDVSGKPDQADKVEVWRI